MLIEVPPFTLDDGRHQLLKGGVKFALSSGANRLAALESRPRAQSTEVTPPVACHVRDGRDVARWRCGPPGRAEADVILNGQRVGYALR
jgi:hypothetical protein